MVVNIDQSADQTAVGNLEDSTQPIRIRFVGAEKTKISLFRVSLKGIS
jgi:hypothetical protein